MESIADTLEHYIAACNVNGMPQTARAISSSIALLRAAAKCNRKALGNLPQQQPEDDIVISTIDHPDGPITLGQLRREAGPQSADDQTHE
jgi:hypothetical protein